MSAVVYLCVKLLLTGVNGCERLFAGAQLKRCDQKVLEISPSVNSNFTLTLTLTLTGVYRR